MALPSKILLKPLKAGARISVSPAAVRFVAIITIALVLTVAFSLWAELERRSTIDAAIQITLFNISSRCVQARAILAEDDQLSLAEILPRAESDHDAAEYYQGGFFWRDDYISLTEALTPITLQEANELYRNLCTNAKAYEARFNDEVMNAYVNLERRRVQRFPGKWWIIKNP